MGPNYLKPFTTIINPTSNEIDFSILSNSIKAEIAVNYILTEAANIHLEIFNSNGYLCKNLYLNPSQFAGSDSHIFNISDLQNGMYIISLRTNGFSKVRKFILSR